MAKGFRCGPGGVTLAFRVAAYATQEAMNAAAGPEQTLGIITNQAITGWSISPDRPETDKIGFVWIQMGRSSTGAVNALSYNEIRICPLSAQQLTEIGWIDRVGKTYLNGAWVAWGPEVTYLFTAGNQHTDLTGGWSGVSSGAGTIAISWEGYVSGEGVGGSCSTKTNKMVDVTDYNVLSVTLQSVDSDFKIQLLNSAGNVAHRFITDKTSGIITSDVSSITGAYYIQLYADGSYLGSSGSAHRGSASFNVSEVSLIKQDLNSIVTAVLDI